VAGGCLYRPWEKGYQITRRAPPETQLPPVGTDVVAAQEEKLAHMRAFVHGQGCRWQAIRRYFGEDADTPCVHCDRCDPEQMYPWSGKSGRDVPDVSDFLDLATTLLELIDWNERRMHDGLSPFGARSLIRILRGDEYTLMRYAPPGPAADARRRVLRACPYWGVCRTLRRSVAELERLLERLLHEALIVSTEAPAARTEHITTISWPNQAGRSFSAAIAWAGLNHEIHVARAGGLRNISRGLQPGGTV